MVRWQTILVHGFMLVVISGCVARFYYIPVWHYPSENSLGLRRPLSEQRSSPFNHQHRAMRELDHAFGDRADKDAARAALTDVSHDDQVCSQS